MDRVLTGYSRRPMAQNTPRNCRTVTYSPAIGRLVLCAIAVGFSVCLGWSLPVPDTIKLPDSLGPLWGPPRPYHVACGGSGNIYVASESSDIMVVDGGTLQRIKRIVTNTPVNGVLLVPRHNRLYCSYPAQHRLGIVDCATNNVVGSIQITTGAGLLCYSTVSDKMYCCDTADNSVSVIGCAADTVLKVIPVGENLKAMDYDPATNKVYVATEDAVQVISCSTDSIVASISAVKGSRGFCLNQRRQKLYAVGPYYDGPYYGDTLFVISTAGDSVVARIGGVGILFPHLVCNEATDRLYGATVAWYIVEFDCSGDTLTRILNTYPGWDIVCDTVKNRLYYLGSDSHWRYLTTFDCESLCQISDVRVERLSDQLVFDQNRGRVLCVGGESEGLLAVFDCGRDSLNPPLAVIPFDGWQLLRRHTICNNPVSHKLYYRYGDGVGGLGVIDEQTNRVVRQVLLPQQWSGDLEYSRTSNKLYCACCPGLAVLDGSTDSLLKFDRGFWPDQMCWYPDSNRLFCFCHVDARMYVAILDCRTDSVIKEIDIYDDIDAVNGFEYLDNDFLLGAQTHGAILIDCRKDSVVMDTTIPGNVYAVTHTGDGKKLYAAHHYTYDRLEALDAHSLALLDTVGWPYSGQVSGISLVCSDSAHKLYWSAGDSTLAIDTRSDTVTARLGLLTRGACFGHSGKYLFCPGPDEYTLTVYDARADTVAGFYPTLWGPSCVTPIPEQGRIFVWCSDAALAFPDTLMSGVCEKAAPVLRWPRQTVVRGVLFLPQASSRKPQAASLMDVSGRKVLGLHAGANDVRVLAPGVYFICEKPQAPGLKPEAVRKIVIAK